MAAASRIWVWCLSLLAAVVLGTILVLSTVESFFGIDLSDQIELDEVEYYRDIHSLPYNASGVPSSHGVRINGSYHVYERIPRILHQTWKTETVPERWASFSRQCRDMHPDYTYMLWTDESSREFIAEHYAWFLRTFDAYSYNIQRADAIRYFVLHRYGGVYLDLDIGCRHPMDPLLHFSAILPATKPVGISNDLMFSEPGSPFMDSVIHSLKEFDHTYLSSYPTVMFSTGPMFLSAMLSLWNAKDAEQVRILPQALYGKNIEETDVPYSFFFHYYGSSWHDSDSAVFTFLGQFGQMILNLGLIIVILGTLRLLWSYRWSLRRSKRSLLPLNDYEAVPSRPTSPAARIFFWHSNSLEPYELDNVGKQ